MYIYICTSKALYIHTYSLSLSCPLCIYIYIFIFTYVFIIYCTVMYIYICTQIFSIYIYIYLYTRSNTFSEYGDEHMFIQTVFLDSSCPNSNMFEVQISSLILSDIPKTYHLFGYLFYLASSCLHLPSRT